MYKRNVFNKPLNLYSKYSAWSIQANWWIPVEAIQDFETSFVEKKSSSNVVLDLLYVEGENCYCGYLLGFPVKKKMVQF